MRIFLLTMGGKEAHFDSFDRDLGDQVYLIIIVIIIMCVFSQKLVETFWGGRTLLVRNSFLRICRVIFSPHNCEVLKFELFPTIHVCHYNYEDLSF